MVLRGKRQRKIKSPSASEQGWLCERVLMSSVVNRHPVAWGNRWREWKSPFWSPPYPWRPLSSISPSHLFPHLLPCAFLHLYLCLFQQTLSLSLCYSLNIPLLSLNTASFRCSSCYQHPPCSLYTSAPYPLWSVGAWQAELSLRHTQKHMHGFDLWSRSLPHQPAITAMLFDHTHFYMVIHNLT